MKHIKTLIIITIVIISSCAKMVPPSGGPKDTTPPKVIKATPPNFSKSNNPKTIEIKFDEYIILKEVNDNLLISPPLNNKPDIKVYGKKIIIKITDTLKENTTYIFNFGNSIRGFTEGNILQNFKYVFSTGQYIDSLKISGYVKNAYSNEPEKNIYVLLYPASCDSCILNTTPSYITTTTKTGKFELTNLKQGTYNIFCLKDINKNFIYDLPGEIVGFTDSTITPTVKILKDSTGEKTIFGPDSIVIAAFEENWKVNAFIKKHKRINPTTLQIFFNKPPDTKPEIIFINPSNISDTIKHYSLAYDSITIWLTDTSTWQEDTISAIINYTTNGNILNDTIHFKWYSKKTTKSPVKLSLKYNTLPPFKKLTILTQIPVKQVDTSKIFIYKIGDTTQTPIKYTVKKGLNTLKFDYDVKEDESYKIIIDSCAIKNIMNNCNDSTGFTFKVRNQDYYGSLSVKLLNKPQYNIIIELTDNKFKKVIMKNETQNSDSLSFNNLPPKDYGLRIIFDENNNGQWDTGNLKKHVQPEKVLYHKDIKIKSSWENHLEIDLKNND